MRLVDAATIHPSTYNPRLADPMLRRAGFSHCECVWRWMNFAAWVGVK